jgi:hypothetical protein
MEPLVTRRTTLEELIRRKEDAVGYLAHKRIRCVRCGEPVWDTLEDAARRAGYGEDEIDGLVEELNRMV